MLRRSGDFGLHIINDINGELGMPEYLSPGVYIEEFEIGAKPMEGVSTSTAGFLGETERGPTTPCLITSWLQYQRVLAVISETTNTSRDQ